MEAAILYGTDKPETSYQKYLFNRDNQKEYKRTLIRGIELIQKKVLSIGKPFSGILPEELAEDFKDIDFDAPFQSVAEALIEVEKLYLDHAIYFHHPKYVAHLNCPVVIPSLMAEVILSSINSSLDTWDQSAGGTFIEQKLIDWTAQKIGLGPLSDGIFTSGGTQSNLMALLLARNYYCDQKMNHNTKQIGLPENSSKFRIFTSEASHFSIQKSLAILGLGYDSVITIPYDQKYKLNVQLLEVEIIKCMNSGLVPIAVIATAGTTDFGSIDPITPIAAICKKHGLWMHVDAAYGCGLLLSQNYRNTINGIELADSVTIDYHKSFFQPVSCGALLVNNKKDLSYVTHYAEYLNPLSQLQEGTPNLVNKSIQTTRRFDALKLWLTLRIMGPKNLGKAFEDLMDLTKNIHLILLSDDTIEVIHQPELTTLVFRYRPAQQCDDEVLDEINACIRKKLFRTGEAVIAGTKVNGRQYLKFTFLNPVTLCKEIEEILKRIKHYGQYYLNQKLQHQSNHAY